MAIYHTLHTQVTRTEDIRRRRRVTQQLSSVRVLADKSFLQGEGVLQTGQQANMFGSAEVLILSSDQPVTVQLLDPSDDTVLSTIPNTRSYSFDVTDTGDSYKVLVENIGVNGDATISWFAFDNLTVGTLTGFTSMLQQQINDNLAAIAVLQSDLATLQADTATNSAAIANLQTTLTALTAQLTALDTTVQSNVTRIDAVETAITALQSDVTALQAAVATNTSGIAALQAAVAANDADILALQTATGGDITALETRIAANEAAIATLQTTVSSNASALATLQTTVLNNGTAISGITSDLSDLQNEVVDNDNDILSLQQLMATTTQAVSDNTADILSLTEGGWPFSFGTIPDSVEVAAFVAPYDMRIPAQTTTFARTRVAPAVESVMTYNVEGSPGSGGNVTFDSLGSGEVEVRTEFTMSKGDVLQIFSGVMGTTESPSFTLETERLLEDATPPAPSATDYFGTAVDYDLGQEIEPRIEFTRDASSLLEFDPRNNPIGTLAQFEFPSNIPSDLSLNPATGDVHMAVPSSGGNDFTFLYDADGLTRVQWGDARVSSGQVFELERISGPDGGELKFTSAPLPT